MAVVGRDGMTSEQREAQQREAERRAAERRQSTHDEYVSQHTSEVAEYRKADRENTPLTEFTNHDLAAIKKMVEDGSRVDGVDRIADAWDQVHDRLVGGKSDGGGGAHGDLERAVRNVLEHWNGESANRFEAQAQKLLKQISNGASHCVTVSEVLRAAATDYRRTHDAVTAIEDPDWIDCTMDWFDDMGERDDRITEEAIKNRTLPKDLLAKADEGFIGAEKEAKLQAASHMETLARNYVTYSKRMKAGDDFSDKDDIPPSEPATPMPAPIPAPSGSASRPGSSRPNVSTGITGGAKAPVTTGPRDAGISGGQQVPAAKTKVDSLPAGLTGGGADDIAGGGSLRGGGAGGGLGAGGAGASGGVPGGGMLGGGAAAGGAAAGRGAMARGGMGGMGAGAGAGAGKGGISGGAGRGPLARSKGGTLGAAKGITGGSPATPGGTGLGRGRGGTGGMLGGGGRNQRPGDEEREQGSRPDYLVEDEETWAPEDNRSVPRTIE